MLYIDTGSRDPYFNFGAEYYFCRFRPKDEMVFLLWRTEPTLMLGKYQNLYEEINLEAAKDSGVHIVRRLSGGGTIYTDLGGWQFSFIDPEGTEEIDFKKYTDLVLQALEAMSIEVEFSGRNDLLIGGKKFSGNAQFQLNGYTVHHGSLLFDSDLDAMTRFSRVRPEKIRSKSIKSVRSRVTNLKDLLGVPMTVEDFGEAFIQRLVGNRRGGLTESEILEIEVLAQEHFRKEDRIYGQSPAFSLTNGHRFAGGRLDLQIEVKKGLIEDLQFTGDFFATDGVNDLKSLFIGLPYRKEVLLQALAGYRDRMYFYRISLEEIINLMFEN